LAPLPVLTCGELAGAWSPLWLLDELPLLLELSSDELLVSLDDDGELDDEPLLLVAAWLVPGRTATTTPAAATLAMVTVTVAAFSLRRPCSRSATARATWRGPAGPACSCQLFMAVRVTSQAPNTAGEWLRNALRVRAADSVGLGFAQADGTATI
jgi:hypothetical protein